MSNENWGAEEWRRPTIKADDNLLYSEFGRIVPKGTYGHDDNGIDYRSHWFCIVRGRHGPCFLLVKHGGGEERIELTYRTEQVHMFFLRLDSTERYLLMHTFHKIHSQAAQKATEATANRFREAFVNGRLKKRKMPKSDRHKVWIEDLPRT